MDQDCSAGLSLGLGIGNGTSTREKDQKYDSQINMNGPLVQLDLFPVAPVLPPDSGCGTLPWEKISPWMGTSGGGGGNERSAGEAKAAIHQVPVSWRSDANKLLASCYCNEDAGAINVSSSNSTVDSNGINPVSGYAGFKRKQGATEELENDLVCSRILNDAEEEDCSKKKLRLSREQCALLEESFSKNRAPEPRQKEALALKLNLRPRQVEVWFQNRRARTKLKQTEVDCELLKRYNDALAEENRKLHKELEELRVRKLSSPLGPAPTLTMCPSCERVSAPRNSSHFTLEKARSMIMRGAFRQ